MLPSAFPLFADLLELLRHNQRQRHAAAPGRHRQQPLGLQRPSEEEQAEEATEEVLAAPAAAAAAEEAAQVEPSAPAAAAAVEEEAQVEPAAPAAATAAEEEAAGPAALAAAAGEGAEAADAPAAAAAEGVEAADAAEVAAAAFMAAVAQQTDAGQATALADVEAERQAAASLVKAGSDAGRPRPNDEPPTALPAHGGATAATAPSRRRGSTTRQRARPQPAWQEREEGMEVAELARDVRPTRLAPDRAGVAAAQQRQAQAAQRRQERERQQQQPKDEQEEVEGGQGLEPQQAPAKKQARHMPHREQRQPRGPEAPSRPASAPAAPAAPPAAPARRKQLDLVSVKQPEGRKRAAPPSRELPLQPLPPLQQQPGKQLSPLLLAARRKIQDAYHARLQQQGQAQGLPAPQAPAAEHERPAKRQRSMPAAAEAAPLHRAPGEPQQLQWPLMAPHAQPYQQQRHPSMERLAPPLMRLPVPQPQPPPAPGAVTAARERSNTPEQEHSPWGW